MFTWFPAATAALGSIPQQECWLSVSPLLEGAHIITRERVKYCALPRISHKAEVPVIEVLLYAS
jgi:hypothetical protein